MANHSDPESCGGYREVPVEALTGETDGPAIEPRNNISGTPTLSVHAEGNTGHDVNRKSCHGPARSENLSTPGSFSYGSSEISTTAGASVPGGAGKDDLHEPCPVLAEKSDTLIVPQKRPNAGNPAEAVEGRGVTKGNADEPPASRTLSRNKRASMGLEGVREAARRDPKLRFTTLMHHITPARLKASFYALRKDAAAGVDEVTWSEYEKILPKRIDKLHQEIQSGAYRAKPSRRVYIPKADGKKRPLGIAAVEDKVVQKAVTTVLNAIYEEDFLDFSYGFREERGQHDALDHLAFGIIRQKVNWILDADIRAFFDEIDHEHMIRFLEHRIGDRRIIRLIRKWLKAGILEDGRRVPATRGTPQGSVISPLLANVYLHYALDLWVQQWRGRYASGEVVAVRYADDSVYGFQHENEARRFLSDLRERLAQFKLDLHPDKTRLICFGRYAAERCRKRGMRKPETFDFLGFTHCCGKTPNGNFGLVRLTIKKRMQATLAAIRKALMRRRHEPIPIVGEWLGEVTRGYLAYYAVPGNYGAMYRFLSEVARAWRHALMRRSQRKRMPWQRFRLLIEEYLPKAETKHPYPEQRFADTTFGGSRMR